MKILLLVSALVALSQGSLVSYVHNIQGHHSFQSLTTEEKLIFAELIVAAETDTVSDFVDRVGYTKIITLLKDMKHEDATKLSALLAEELGYHNHDVQKRDDSDENSGSDDDDDNSARLSNADKKVYEGLRKASRTNQLAGYMDTLEAGAIFGLLEKLDAADGDKLMQELLATLNNVEKRDDSDADSGSDDSDDDDDNSARLSNADKKVYEGLRKASRTNQLAGYMDTLEAGAIFGLLEKLDAADAGKLMQDMLATLNNVEKRDDSDEDSGSDDDDDKSARLSNADNKVYEGLRKASRTNQLAGYMDTLEAGAIFGLLEKLDAADAGKLMQDMLATLNNVEKRDDSDEDSGSDDDDDKSARLSNADNKVYEGLRKASRTNQLAGYMDTLEAGAIFGLLEKLDAADAGKLMQDMLATLNNVEKRDDSDEDSGSDDDDDKSARLSNADNKVYEGLRKASRTNQLAEYMDTLEAGAIFGLLEKLDAADAGKLMQDMLATLNNVEKRDDSDEDSGSDDDDDKSARLSNADNKVYEGLRKASRTNQLAGYMDTLEAGAIFGLLEKLDAADAGKLMQDMLATLNNVEKRDDSDEDSGSDDDDDKSARLSNADNKVYEGLRKASRTNQLAGYMDTLEAGAIFGLLEKLDAADAGKLMQDMLATLNNVEKRDDSDEDSGSDDDDDKSARLSNADNKVYEGLRKASRTNQLAGYMDTLEAGAIFGLLEKLDAADAGKLMQDMLATLNNVEKRDDSDEDSGSDDDDDKSARLSNADNKVYEGLRKASRTNQLAGYMDTLEAGAIFGLLEKLDAADAGKLMQDMLATLNNVEKRDDSDEDSGSDDDDDKSARLSNADNKVYEGLRKASRTNQLAGYMDTLEAGAIFGLLEKLDADQADKLINELLNNMEV